MCIKALIVPKIITSDQISLNLINGLHSFLPKLCLKCFVFTTRCLPSLCHMLRSVLLLFIYSDGPSNVVFLPSAGIQAYRPGCTCGHVSTVVTMVSIIRAPGWCNDKGGPLALCNLLHFYLLSSSSRASSDCHSRSGMQFSSPQGFPCCCPATRSAVIHLSSSVSVALLSFPPL